ncbi:MAG: CHAT domain-containing protein, partial [Geitlerinemataceae cyanobacterium]
PEPAPEPEQSLSRDLDTQDFQREGRSTANTPNLASADRSDERTSLRLEGAFESGNLKEIVGELEDLRSQEYASYLGVDSTVPTQDLSIGQIQNDLKLVSEKTGRAAALIYIVSRDDRLELLMIPPKGSPVRRTLPEVSREELFAEVAEFRRALTSPRSRDSDRYLEPAQQLYQWLIAPLEPDLENLEIDTLLFCLEAGLRSLPLAALHDGSQFLVENYNFSLVPSFSLLDRTYSPIAKERVLAMGASEFRDLPPLPGVPLELQLVTDSIDSKPDSSALEGESFLNDRFTEENLKAQRQAASYDIVHLATHANFQSGDPGNSYIQFWDKGLRLNQLPELNLNDPPVNLLVLSACQTALGDREAELGFGGLALYSGARSAVASLWAISDAGTLTLMGSLYHHLGTAPIKAEALQLAQRDLISGAVRWDGEQLQVGDRPILLPPELRNMGELDLSHPYYWSGFTTIGSPW